MVRVTVSGCNGRMGKIVKKLVEDDPQLELAGAFDINDDAATAIELCDVLIEFTTPDATVKNLKIAERLGKAVVIGTTGLDKEKTDLVKEISSKVPIVFSPNMSIGVNLLFKLVGSAVSVLDSTYRASISETHHTHKKDAPSGTAKRLRNIIADRINRGDLEVESHRKGEVVGDHTVIFDGREEVLEITHRAKSRDVFARGAVIAAKFAASKEKGLYGMDEVLGISD